MSEYFGPLQVAHEFASADSRREVLSSSNGNAAVMPANTWGRWVVYFTSVRVRHVVLNRYGGTTLLEYSDPELFEKLERLVIGTPGRDPPVPHGPPRARRGR